MRQFVIIAALLMLTTSQVVAACDLCVDKPTPEIRVTDETNTAVTRVTEVPLDGLSLSAATTPACPHENCPCCPSDTDCTDCVKCAGGMVTFVIPESADQVHLLSAAAASHFMSMPCSRAIAIPGRPPQLIL